MKRLLALVLVLLASSACGVLDSPLEKQYKRLEKEAAATDSSVAEKLYRKAEALVQEVEKNDNAPEDLHAKVRALQQRRAKEFAKAAARNWDIGSAAKVVRALLGSGLDPKVETAAVGVAPTEVPPKVDPTSDKRPSELGWK